MGLGEFCVYSMSLIAVTPLGAGGAEGSAKYLPTRGHEEHADLKEHKTERLQ